MTARIPRRTSTALLQSLAAGVVPRTGLEHIAVGRHNELRAMLDDLDTIIAEGGASFRVIMGKYGSGKSFLCQLIRNYALQRNFVVADADFSPDRRLAGTNRQGVGLYRELLRNMATRTRPEGNAFAAIFERWISDVQNAVLQENSLTPQDPRFNGLVEQRIYQTIQGMEGMVHGFDFATVVSAYWQGHAQDDDIRKNAALRWLRGEYNNKTEARADLGVRVIIDDASWYDYIKLIAQFVHDIGYKGLVLFLDEAVNLYKISNRVARQNNYERLLTILNDVLQGRAQYFGVILGGTPQMVEDPNRGLYNYEALRTRLEPSRFAADGLLDFTGPLVRLAPLSPTELFVLLQNLRQVHALHHKYDPTLTDQQLQAFLKYVYERVGADQLLTPRELIRDFIAVLNILDQNPGQNFEQVVFGSNFEFSSPTIDTEALTPENEIHDEPDNSDSPFASFQI